ncbi:O-antigen ligase [Flexibacter flexilis DSM 6793]|uniref:O-antigen ligase n=1 Tax=Flexibacter flexilis DSM 6793 TaxID=927664 RepID=A0A1I1HTB0_9BACT|nr:O-antigen ligase family protein [Flexibacter flexilis]SFC27101.1 O-antigen ligase [Flexibacter flexilis DSM 6793]
MSLFSLPKLQHNLLLAIAFTIPLPKLVGLNSVLIVILAISTIIFHIKNRSYYFLKNKNIWFLSSFFGAYLIAGLWTSNPKAYGFELEKKATLLLLPVCFSGLHFSKKEISSVLWAFVIACCLLPIMGIAVGVYRSYTLMGSYWHYEFFLGQSLVHFVGLHRGYVALHTGLSILFLLFFTEKTNTKNILIASYLLVFTFFLNARIAIIGLMLIAVIYSIMAILNKNKKAILFVIVGLLSMICVLFGSEKLSHMTKQLFTLNFENVTPQTVDEYNSIEIRYFIWKSAIATIQESPVWGYGAGAGNDALANYYNKSNFTLGQRDNYNAHNQYLQAMLDAGIMGLIVLISWFVYMLIFAYKHKSIFYFFFVLYIAVNCLAENIFSIQKGIVFFAFFNSIIFFFLEQKNKETNSTYSS